MDYKILVVEDDLNINQVICEYLKDSYFIPIPAYDGKTALDIIENNESIDLFILDIMLPNITGLELLKTVKNDLRHKEKLVMILTAIADEYTQLESFNHLADDYVTKPFSPKVLIKRVQALLRRSVKTSGRIELGDIMLDTDAFEAYEKDKKLNLTLREFELLLFFTSNPKKALSRQQILNQVWGYDYYGDERIVDVHIKNLRKKLDSDIIATVKGIGYKLELSVLSNACCKQRGGVI